MTEAELRQTVRRAYDFACGYCDVREEDAGSELELDHFKPRSLGGGEKVENLVYCCTTCNRFKGDFWTASTDEKRILHPQRDDLNLQLRQDSDGLLTRNGKISFKAVAPQLSTVGCSASGRIANSLLREKLNEAQVAQKVWRWQFFHF
ncbi:hypothetical protein BH20ACI1_BH20ACI1_31170 [soil metagenome]